MAMGLVLNVADVAVSADGAYINVERDDGGAILERDTRSPTILVVDDNAAIRSFVKKVLVESGYNVHTAADGEEGLICFERNRPTIALLLTDVMMPNMNGLELADRVLERCAHLPVLFMSGDAEGATRGFGCLRKPFKTGELIGRVSEVLDSTSMPMSVEV
jgi:CheY-like chemotaxis protein